MTNFIFSIILWLLGSSLVTSSFLYFWNASSLESISSLIIPPLIFTSVVIIFAISKNWNLGILRFVIFLILWTASYYVSIMFWLVIPEFVGKDSFFPIFAAGVSWIAIFYIGLCILLVKKIHFKLIGNVIIKILLVWICFSLIFSLNEPWNLDFTIVQFFWQFFVHTWIFYLLIKEAPHKTKTNHWII